MLRSYARRKRWEADLLARTIINTLGEALGGGSSEAPRTPSGQKVRWISAEAMLGKLGLE